MAYNIYLSDGTPVNIPDNAIDISYYNPTANGSSPDKGLGIQLIGRNTIGYGAAIAQNFLQITENFSSSLAAMPTDAIALQGQLWFNKLSNTTGNLYLRVTNNPSGGLSNWNKVAVEDSSGNLTIGGTITAGSFVGSFAGTAATATNVAGGFANEILYQSAPGITSFISPPSLPNTLLQWNGSSFTWAAVAGSVTSVNASGGSTGLSFSGGPITTTGTLTLSGTLGVSNGGTGLFSTPSNGQLLIGNGTGFTLTTLSANPGIGIVNGIGTITLFNTGVTSFSAGTTGFTPSSSSSGSITLSGTLSVSNGGTGLTTTPSNGQIDIGNGTGFTRTNITAGTGINVSNGAGTITLSNAGVTSTFAGTGISVSASTGSVTINNTGVTSNVAGTGISISGPTGAVTINNTGVTSALAGSGISVSGATGAVTFNNTGVTSAVAGTGISVSSSVGAVTINNTGVTSFSAGTTGMAPNSPTTGAVTLSGILASTNGGTGQSTYAKGDIVYASAVNTLSKLTIGTTGQILTADATGVPVWANTTAPTRWSSGWINTLPGLSTTTSFLHSLGANIAQAWILAECITAGNGAAVGDRCEPVVVNQNSYSYVGTGLYWTSTSIVLKTSAQAWWGVTTTGAPATQLTPANWKYQVIATT